MKVVMICPPGEGHYSVFFPLANQYQQQGDDVIFLTLAEGEERCLDAGVNYQVYGEKLLPKGKLSELVYERGKEKGMKAMKLMAEELRLMEQSLLDCAADKICEINPDLLIGDQVFLSISSLAERAKCRCHILSTTLPFQTHPDVPPVLSDRVMSDSFISKILNRIENGMFELFSKPIVKLINSRRKKWSLGLLASANACYSLAEKCYSHCPKGLDYPNINTLLNVEYLPIMTRDQFRKAADQTWQENLSDKKPLIYVSLGTMQNNDESIFVRILNAINFDDYQVLVSIGGNEGLVNSLTSQFPHAIIRTFVPQLEVLSRAAVFISHAGMNSTIEAIITDTPVLALPIMGDQKAIGARIEFHGIGIRLSIKKMSSEEIKNNIIRMLNESQFKENILKVKSASEM